MKKLTPLLLAALISVAAANTVTLTHWDNLANSKYWMVQTSPDQPADKAYAWDLEFKDLQAAHQWTLMQHAKHTADMRIVFNGETTEMSFDEFHRRIFGK